MSAHHGESTRLRRTTRCGVVVVALAAASLVGCAGNGTEPREVCVVFQASKNLNLYQGEPHPVTLLVYPLTSAVAFEQTSVSSLLEGKRPVGAPVPPIPFTISPGEERLFEDSFGPATTEIGIVADFYRAPEDPEGSRLQVVPAECGWFKTTLVLSPRDIYVK